MIRDEDTSEDEALPVDGPAEDEEDPADEEGPLYPNLEEIGRDDPDAVVEPEIEPDAELPDDGLDDLV